MVDYSEGFWITMTGLIIGFLGVSVRMCLRSKCDNVELCCLKIHRNVEVEEKAEEVELKYGVYDGQEKKGEEKI
jgi:hypothetical protein